MGIIGTRVIPAVTGTGSSGVKSYEEEGRELEKQIELLEALAKSGLVENGRMKS